MIGYKSNYKEQKLLKESEIAKRCETLETKWGCAAQVYQNAAICLAMLLALSSALSSE